MIDLTLIRQLTEKDGKSKVERALKLCEEAGEVAAAVLSETNAPGCEYKTLDRVDVLEELADTLILTGSMLEHYEFTDEEVNQQISKKCEKWERVLKEGVQRKQAEAEANFKASQETGLSIAENYLGKFLDFIEEGDFFIKPRRKR